MRSQLSRGLFHPAFSKPWRDKYLHSETGNFVVTSNQFIVTASPCLRVHCHNNAVEPTPPEFGGSQPCLWSSQLTDHCISCLPGWFWSELSPRSHLVVHCGWAEVTKVTLGLLSPAVRMEYVLMEAPWGKLAHIKLYLGCICESTCQDKTHGQDQS